MSQPDVETLSEMCFNTDNIIKWYFWTVAQLLGAVLVVFGPI